MEYNEIEVRNAAEALLRSTDIHPNQTAQTPNLDMCKFCLFCKRILPMFMLGYILTLNSLIFLSFNIYFLLTCQPTNPGCSDNEYCYSSSFT